MYLLGFSGFHSSFKIYFLFLMEEKNMVKVKYVPTPFEPLFSKSNRFLYKKLIKSCFVCSLFFEKTNLNFKKLALEDHLFNL